MYEKITVIIKPTLLCNVKCRHCAVTHRKSSVYSPEFYLKALQRIVEFRKCYLGFDTREIEVVWHGGEPMLMGPRFYEEVALYLDRAFPLIEVKHSMQTNLLLYSRSSRWKAVFESIFDWYVSTSYDFFSSIRPYSAEEFLSILKKFQDDSGKSGYVICVLSHENYRRVLDICRIAEKEKFDVKLNYLYPAGSGKNLPLFSPEMYFESIREVYLNRSVFSSDIKIDPMDFFEEYRKGERTDLPCPYTSNCCFTIFAVYPDGKIFNCAELGDVNCDPYGNVETGIIPENFFSHLAKRLAVSEECYSCSICGGGCIKQRILYSNSMKIEKKTPFCEMIKFLLLNEETSVPAGR